jgi:hypothetical protein
LLPRPGEDRGLLPLLPPALLVLRGLIRLVNAAGSCFRRGLALLPLLLPPMESRSCCSSAVAERCACVYGSCACACACQINSERASHTHIHRRD